ncbi:methyl-accepting chemotaxis protein [Nitrogeniibacter mangrovi]|uniref:Methyl-accepting chemotaxis protein n=2 Tax=Nitrogeniibacter mangrovi TaxID=2016596 RepID=A0A6C1B531_9RHOO|nr:methyl-accepting chemotaxis protein [Nitrogeniibacter mangrovi]
MIGMILSGGLQVEPWALVLAVLGTGVGVWSARELRQVDACLDALAAHTVRLQQGDFITRIEPPRVVALQPLVARYNALSRTMAGLVAHFARLAQELASVAGESSVNADKGDESARAQRDLTHSSAAAIEQFSCSMRTAGDLAAGAAEEASCTGIAAQENAVVTDRLKSTLQTLSQSVADSARDARQLAEGYRQIETITALISEIADQTNLLSLNAAIEAARAGDTGRGFAVVADEVRKLADRTANATGDIDAIVQRLRGYVESMESGMRATGDRAECSVLEADAAAHALGAMADQSRRMRDMVHGIAEAMREQGVASQAIAGDVEHVADLADRNELMSRENSELARYLQQLAGQLRDVLTPYRYE